MPVHPAYAICNYCRKMGVFQRVGDQIWSCRYCGYESADRNLMVDEHMQCTTCGELLTRGVKQALEFLYERPRSISSQELAAIMEEITAANATYVQGMSPNGAAKTALEKLIGFKLEFLTSAAQHVQRYHHGSQRRSVARARKAARQLAKAV